MASPVKYFVVFMLAIVFMMITLSEVAH